MKDASILGKLRKCKCKVTFWSLTKGDKNDSMVCKMTIRARFMDLEMMLEVDV